MISIISSFSPIVLGLMGILMVVLRAGASQVFFDVVGRFQAKRLIQDADTQMTVFNALILDSVSNIQEAGQAFGESMDAFVQSLLPTTLLIADATIELQKFVSEGEDFEAIKEDVMEIGASFGYTGDQALLAAAKMAQLSSVLGEGQTAVGSQLGFEFGLISGMETEKAMQRLVNLNQQIHFMTEGTEGMIDAEQKGLVIRENTLRVLDKLNTIENRSAATMEQVTFVMNQFASQANLTGESIAFMAAQSALLIEAGEEQGKGGRALKAVYARLGADTSGAATELQNMGIQTHNANGALKPLSQILKQLNEQWPTMEKGQQQNIAQLVAGNRHYTRLIKLIEGYDRILQLQHEGEMALMPALDEVNIRLESNVNRYREAEASLSNYQARLGDALLPSLTMATEKQAAFNLAIAEYVEMSPTLIGGTFGLISVFKGIAGPVLNTFLMFQSLTVASGTLATVGRALAGAEIVKATAFGQSSEAVAKATDTYRQLNFLRNNELHNIKQETIEIKKLTAEQLNFEQSKLAMANNGVQATKINLNSTKQMIAMVKEEIALEKIKLDGIRATLNAEGQLGVVTDKQTSEYLQMKITLEELMVVQQQELNLLGAEAQKREAAANKIAIHRQAVHEKFMEEEERAGKLLAKKTMQMNAFAGAGVAAGGALMLFSNNNKSMRLGMALSTISMLAFTAAQLNSQRAAVLETLAQSEKFQEIKKAIGQQLLSIYHMEAGIFSTNRSTVATKKHSAAVKLDTISLKARIGALQGTFTAFAATTLAITAVAAGLLLYAKHTARATYETNRLKLELNDMTGGSANLTEVMGGLSTTTSEGALKGIEDQRMKISKLQNLEGELVDSQLKTELDVLATMEEQYRILLAMESTRESSSLILTDEMNTFLDLTKDIQDTENKFRTNNPDGLMSLFGGGTSYKDNPIMAFAEGIEVLGNRLNPLNVSSDTILSDTNEQLEILKTNSPQFLQVFKGIEEGLIVDNASLLTYLQSIGVEYNELFNTIDDAAANTVTDSWLNATEAIQKFSNSREELFYGMNANNLTGDLIKQVQQTGVENLISNTEVIMTNNFNGMTTREVANEILAQISQGAGGMGINMNLKTI